MRRGKCKHENADHLKAGEWFTMRTEHGDQPMHVVDCEQLRCLDCGAWLSLGQANDDERVAVEIRAALLAIDVGAEETIWTSEEIGGGFVAAAWEPGARFNDDLRGDPQCEAGYLAWLIQEHDALLASHSSDATGRDE